MFCKNERRALLILPCRFIKCRIYHTLQKDVTRCPSGKQGETALFYEDMQFYEPLLCNPLILYFLWRCSKHFQWSDQSLCDQRAQNLKKTPKYSNEFMIKRLKCINPLESELWDEVDIHLLHKFSKLFLLQRFII